MDEYEFLDDLMLRTPSISYKEYYLETIHQVICDESFKGALFLANPSLYRLIAAKDFNWEVLNPKEKLTISRYYNRMCFRPTPFGTFAAFYAVKWGKNGASSITVGTGNRLHLLLDQEIALRLADTLRDKHPGKQFYILNPTIYAVNREFRFVKTIMGGQLKFAFSIESMDDNRLITALLRHIRIKCRSLLDITGHICRLTGCGKDEAQEYFNFLVDAQIIKSTWDTNISGKDYLDRLLHEEPVPVSPFKNELSNVYQTLRAISEADTRVLRQVKGRINDLLAESGSNGSSQVFYAGLEGKIQEGSLGDHYQRDIREGVKVLQLLVPPAGPSELQQFIAGFKARYDLQRVPLLQALDPELGIGYGGMTSDKAEPDLLKDIKFGNVQKHQELVNWTFAHRLLFRKWCESTRPNSPLVLNVQDVAELDASIIVRPLPASFPAMFRVFDDQVFLESVGGASANNLIGRFTLWSDKIGQIASHIAGLEQAAKPEIIFAEIGQISGHHADNISRRQRIYPFEIPINVVSALPEDKQLSLADLVLSVRDDELILESLSLNQQVMPRMSSAFNYYHNQLSVFRLLCDLQYQGIQANLTLDMEILFPGMTFYPRVAYQNTILCLAKWYLSKQQINYLAGDDLMAFPDRLDEIKEQLALPDWIAITRHDQQIVFNLGTREDQLFFLDCIRGSEQVLLQEYPLAKDAAVRQATGKPLIGQFIAFLYKNEAANCQHKKKSESHVLLQAQRDYMLGSQWVYLKIYCHPGSSNHLLVRKILPRIRAFGSPELLCWFFIRYVDSGHHIRLRLRIKDDALGLILRQLKESLAGALHFQLVREYQADTYRRELERYGADMMELAEDFFSASSELVLAFIRRSLAKGFTFSYHSLAFVTVCRMVEAFWTSLDDQLNFFRQMSGTFYAEFSGDKSLRVDMDLKYREIKKEISSLVKDDLYFRKLRIRQWADLFWLRQNLILATAGAFSAQRKTQLLADLIHMHLNRLFTEKQRNQELIVYYCLYKHKIAEHALRK
jgi:thiopeptide-type bacteriocin biosynthesis protein